MPPRYRRLDRREPFVGWHCQGTASSAGPPVQDSSMSLGIAEGLRSARRSARPRRVLTASWRPSGSPGSSSLSTAPTLDSIPVLVVEVEVELRSRIASDAAWNPGRVVIGPAGWRGLPAPPFRVVPVNPTSKLPRLTWPRGARSSRRPGPPLGFRPRTSSHDPQHHRVPQGNVVHGARNNTPISSSRIKDRIGCCSELYPVPSSIAVSFHFKVGDVCDPRLRPINRDCKPVGQPGGCEDDHIHRHQC